MSSSPSTAVRVLRLRVKDKHAAWLCGLAREVNTVFNYCNDLAMKGFERERRFLSGFDFWPSLKGVTRGDCALHLPIQAVQEIAEEYARRRRQHGKIRLAWRKSGGARRNLGWISIKVRTIRYRGGQVYFAGRWYLDVCVPRAQRVADGRNKSSVGSILDRSVPSVGIDLGLKSFAAFSDGTAPIDAKRCDDASVCSSRAGPKGRKDLGIRGWQRPVCGAIHDRDVNAAHNILAAGHRRLAEEILVT